MFADAPGISDDIYFRGKSKCIGNAEFITIGNHHRIELFYTVVDMQYQL
jgi:hypothetical protein